MKAVIGHRCGNIAFLIHKLIPIGTRNLLPIHHEAMIQIQLRHCVGDMTVSTLSLLQQDAKQSLLALISKYIPTFLGCWNFILMKVLLWNIKILTVLSSYQLFPSAFKTASLVSDPCCTHRCSRLHLVPAPRRQSV